MRRCRVTALSNLGDRNRLERRLAAQAGLALALALVSPQGGSATIVKATRLAIKTHGTNLSARGFSITYRTGPTASKRDGGTARCIFKRSGPSLGAMGERRQLLTGTEVLTSSTGALTLRWVAVQTQSDGRWGESAAAGGPSRARTPKRGAAGAASSGRRGHWGPSTTTAFW
jgi:hypothetical protein